MSANEQNVFTSIIPPIASAPPIALPNRVASPTAEVTIDVKTAEENISSRRNSTTSILSAISRSDLVAENSMLLNANRRSAIEDRTSSAALATEREENANNDAAWRERFRTMEAELTTERGRAADAIQEKTNAETAKTLAESRLLTAQTTITGLRQQVATMTLLYNQSQIAVTQLSSSLTSSNQSLEDQLAKVRNLSNRTNELSAEKHALVVENQNLRRSLNAFGQL